MSEYRDFNLQLLAGECRKLSVRHEDGQVRMQAENFYDKYLLQFVFIELLSVEQQKDSREELRIRMLDFVERNLLQPA